MTNLNVFKRFFFISTKDANEEKGIYLKSENIDS